jgi:hypothetical protein
MGNVKLEPGWLTRDVIQAARRTHELDLEKNQIRSDRENRVNEDRASKPDLAKKN